MNRYILTGTPGSGKTSIIRFLKMHGYCTVEEAATDIIYIEQTQGNKEPWVHPGFIDQIIDLQKQRQMTATTGKIQFYDRSPVCTYALSKYLGYEPSIKLLAEIKRIKRLKIYRKEVFFIENLGFCEPSKARKITFAEALRFEQIHKESYKSFGYKCIKIPPLSITERTKIILELSNSL